MYTTLQTSQTLLTENDLEFNIYLGFSGNLTQAGLRHRGRPLAIRSARRRLHHVAYVVGEAEDLPDDTHSPAAPSAMAGRRSRAVHPYPRVRPEGEVLRGAGPGERQRLGCRPGGWGESAHGGRVGAQGWSPWSWQARHERASGDVDSMWTPSEGRPSSRSRLKGQKQALTC